MRCRITPYCGAGWAAVMAAALTVAAQAVAGPAAGHRPNFVVILLDDLGYSDLGCYGGEIRTPNIDRLAAGGLRFTRFYNASRCCPTRAALLAGLYPHQVGLSPTNGRDLNRDSATIAELLRTAGYQTADGQVAPLGDGPTPWQGRSPERLRLAQPSGRSGPPLAGLDTYPVNRGFERFYGTIWGVVNYFDPFSLVEGAEPVEDVPDGSTSPTRSPRSRSRLSGRWRTRGSALLLVAFPLCPHWPLHARPEDVTARRTAGAGTRCEARIADRSRSGCSIPRIHPLPALMGHGARLGRVGCRAAATSRR